jgi:hypothetical protein
MPTCAPTQHGRPIKIRKYPIAGTRRYLLDLFGRQAGGKHAQQKEKNKRAALKNIIGLAFCAAIKLPDKCHLQVK